MKSLVVTSTYQKKGRDKLKFVLRSVIVCVSLNNVSFNAPKSKTEFEQCICQIFLPKMGSGNQESSNPKVVHGAKGASSVEQILLKVFKTGFTLGLEASGESGEVVCCRL